MKNLELIDATGCMGGVKKLSFGLPVPAISHVPDISLKLQNGRAPYWGSASYTTHSFCHPHCSLCSVCFRSPYYLPVCLFIHLFIPWHHQTLSACPAVSTAHLISSWLNSSLSICSYKLFDFYYFILSLSSFQSSYLTHSGFSIGQYNYCK